jgi:hypothetical protein
VDTEEGFHHILQGGITRAKSSKQGRIDLAIAERHGETETSYFFTGLRGDALMSDVLQTSHMQVMRTLATTVALGERGVEGGEE